jgi:hypothetical protein
MLDVLLALYCERSGGVLLEIDEGLDAVSLGKSGDQTIAVLKHTAEGCL